VLGIKCVLASCSVSLVGMKHLTSHLFRVIYRSLSGASLISPHFALTAAHCLFYLGSWDPPTYVEFYRHSLMNDAGVTKMYFKNTDQCEGDVVFHPNYDDYTLENDIALLHLPNGIYDIEPVILNENSRVPLDGASLDVSGELLVGTGKYICSSSPSHVSLNVFLCRMGCDRFR